MKEYLAQLTATDFITTVIRPLQKTEQAIGLQAVHESTSVTPPENQAQLAGAVHWATRIR